MNGADIAAILQGAVVTITLSAIGILIGLPIGLGLALIRWANVPVLGRIVALYVSMLRATPLVTLLLLLFFALPNIGVPMSPVSAAILGLVMSTSAFNCEVWRSALMNFPKDQYEAAQSVGMNASDIAAIFQGAIVTITLSLIGILIGLPIGLGLALIRWANVPVVARIVALYVSVLRATPLVTLLLLLFFALPNIGVPMSPVSAAILGLVMSTSAFNCEVWRSALMNFPKDQYEAAQSVGMHAGLRFRRIVLPQIIRVSLPGLVNEMSLLIKVTPVLAVVGVVDITRAAVRIGAQTYEPLPPFLVAIAIYVPIVFALVSLQRWIERRQTTAEALA